MDALEEFRVAHRSRLAALFGQSVADGLNAFKQHGDVSTYDPAALAAALFGDLPAGPDSPSDDEGRPSGSAQLPASTVESGHTWETLWWEATPSVIGRQTQQMFRVRKPPRQTTPTSCQWSWTTPSSREIRRPVRCDLQSQEQRGRTSEEVSADKCPRSGARHRPPVRARLSQRSQGQERSRTKARQVWLLRLLRLQCRPLLRLPQPMTQDPRRPGPPPGYYRGWTGDPRGAAVPVNTEATMLAWAPLVAQEHVSQLLGSQDGLSCEVPSLLCAHLFEA